MDEAVYFREGEMSMGETERIPGPRGTWLE